jgi:UDP-glucose 4-epimerase
MRTELGFEPEFTTAEAFADFAASMPPSSRAVSGSVDLLADLLPTGARRG